MLRPVEFIQIAVHRLQMAFKGQIWGTGEKSFKFSLSKSRMAAA